MFITMQTCKAAVRLALDALTKCNVMHLMRTDAERVLEAAAAEYGGDYAALNEAYRAMLAARADVRRTGQAFTEIARKHGNPLWSGTVNHAYTQDIELASVEHDKAKEARDKRESEFYALASAFYFAVQQ
jgi:hypothetical protein